MRAVSTLSRVKIIKIGLRFAGSRQGHSNLACWRPNVKKKGPIQNITHLIFCSTSGRPNRWLANKWSNSIWTYGYDLPRARDGAGLCSMDTPIIKLFCVWNVSNMRFSHMCYVCFKEFVTCPRVVSMLMLSYGCKVDPGQRMARSDQIWPRFDNIYDMIAQSSQGLPSPSYTRSDQRFGRIWGRQADQMFLLFIKI